MKLDKKMITIISVVALLGIGGTVGAVVVHNNQVQAAELKKKEAKEAYEQLKKEVTTAIDTAYDSRKGEDIKAAEDLVTKLKKKDQDEYTGKITQLQKLLTQIKGTSDLIGIAEKSKKDTDVTAAQTAINEEKDEYLTKDRKAHQERLDKVTKAIAADKAKEEEAKKVAAEKAKAEAATTAEAQQAAQAEAAAVAATTTPAPDNTYVAGTSGGSADTGYQAPTQGAGTPAPAAPSQPAAPAPSAPASNQGVGEYPSQETLNSEEVAAGNGDYSDLFGK